MAAKKKKSATLSNVVPKGKGHDGKGSGSSGDLEARKKKLAKLSAQQLAQQGAGSDAASAAAHTGNEGLLKGAHLIQKANRRLRAKDFNQALSETYRKPKNK
jgi:hypothetical protein